MAEKVKRRRKKINRVGVLLRLDEDVVRWYEASSRNADVSRHKLMERCLRMVMELDNESMEWESRGLHVEDERFAEVVGVNLIDKLVRSGLGLTVQRRHMGKPVGGKAAEGSK